MFECNKCKQPFPLHLLDAKPPSLANLKANHAMLIFAADNGEDFTILQCKDCYGPAWEIGAKDD